MTQPEALRLADALDNAPYSSPCTNDSAAELRRLHAENESLALNLRMEETISFRRQMQTYAAQRDALLEALKQCERVMQVYGPKETLRVVRAAIAKAEGEKA